MSARILAHSCHASPFESIRSASEIVTLELCYPRFIHSEFMTHRHISRNARSSRAVPTTALIHEVASDPVLPVFRSNQKGMQPGAELTEGSAALARIAWLMARDRAIEAANKLLGTRVHKQWANRLLEPFSRIHVVATASMFWWGSFLALRDHPAAQDEIQDLAREIAASITGSSPHFLVPGEWHAPYLQTPDWPTPCTNYDSAVIAAARCARVSYKPFDSDTADRVKDVKLAQDLMHSNHWSPFEHVCTPGETSGNLPGWVQLRHILERQ